LGTHELHHTQGHSLLPPWHPPHPTPGHSWHKASLKTLMKTKLGFWTIPSMMVGEGAVGIMYTCLPSPKPYPMLHPGLPCQPRGPRGGWGLLGLHALRWETGWDGQGGARRAARSPPAASLHGGGCSVQLTPSLEPFGGHMRKLWPVKVGAGEQGLGGHASMPRAWALACMSAPHPCQEAGHLATHPLSP